MFSIARVLVLTISSKGSLSVVNRTMVCRQRECYTLELRLTFSRTCSEQSASQHYAMVLNV